MTDLDRECEAQLHQYRAQHDLGVDHLDSANVYFRNYLEDTWCRHFIWFLKDQAPSKLALWRAPVLDAGRLLTLFHKYQAFEPPPPVADDVVTADGASSEVQSAHPLPLELRK